MIQNGATLTSTGNGTIRNGATVTVTGIGSQWIVSGTLSLGGAAPTLNIENGGTVVVTGPLGFTPGSSIGTLNISGGALEAGVIRLLAASDQANYDNAVVRARAANTSFFGGTVTQHNIAAGGLTFDSNGFNDGALGFSGVGGLTKTGAGTFTLTDNSTYTGTTVVQAGTLALTGTGSIASSSRVVANSTFDISGITAGGTSIQSLAGNGGVSLGTKTLTITNANDTFAGVIGGTGGLTVSAGTQTLSGANTYSGATTLAGGSLRAGGAGAFSAASGFVASAGTTLDLNGFNQTIASLDNAGTVRFGSAPGTTLTVTGNYIGNGGTLLFNTVLGGDSSATDRMVVQGATSGASTLRIANIGGGGAQTSEGIKVIDVAGASNGTFALQGDYAIGGQQAVISGAYAYTLQKNGISTPTDGDWYLRSSLINPPPSVPTGPLYQAGVPLYENYAQVLLGMNQAPSLQQRVGNRYWGGSEAMARAGVNTAQTSDGSRTQSAFWGRIEGGQSALRPSNTTGSTYSSDEMKAQVGFDGAALDNAHGRLIVGLTAQYGLTTAFVNSPFGNGRIRAQGTGVGATATWYGHDGFYVDGQAQTMFYRSDLSSVLVGSMTHGNEGFGYAFSVEGGKRIAVGNGFWLAPQAQLAYSKVGFDAFTDRFGALVSLGNADSLLGRLGLSLNHQRTWNDGTGIVRSDLYAIGNLHYEFLGGTRIDVAGTGFASGHDRLWGSIGGGGTYSWANGRYAVFGEITYRASVDDPADNHGYRGTGGFRVWGKLARDLDLIAPPYARWMRGCSAIGPASVDTGVTAGAGFHIADESAIASRRAPLGQLPVLSRLISLLRRIPAVNWAFSRLRPVPHGGNLDVAPTVEASPAIAEDVASTAPVSIAEISADPVHDEADPATAPVAENDEAVSVVAEIPSDDICIGGNSSSEMATEIEAPATPPATEEASAASAVAENEPVAASDLAIVDDGASPAGVSAEVDSAAAEEIVASSADLATASADLPAVIIEAALSPDVSLDAVPDAAEAIPVDVENVAAVVSESSVEIDPAPVVAVAPAPANDVPLVTAVAAVANESSSDAAEADPAPALTSTPELRSVPKVRARAAEPADRAALIRQRWAESGIRMWNPRLHGTGEAALNIQGSVGLLPPAPGETMPRYDKLEFRMLGGQIVCEGVIVEAPVQASHRSFTRLEPRSIERVREPARERQAVLA
ncbi:autotransporter outer membrane beta-barrel domain-containing protein [Bradyrhizobium sp. CB1015]|uniref:autotransporter outer membrane beta-barrel domain-containing protein n=1 Tax=Bradyrhizobium sp. CB1015 TaxID=2976822 RepID=UPI0021AAA4A6|nr:autotransporter outer membrane beta-barrel domain-containing protein [Bradyrhizobium sp. CB1015]UWU90889.1 autotransporter outer membrane beta-barrel domain-containing protein [Bradyrhizobium sp. CB1015]